MALLSRNPRTPIGALPTGTNFLNVDSNGYTADQIDALIQALVNAGASNGTAIITANDPPSPTGMVSSALLLTRGWTITSECAIITTDTTFAVNEDGSWKLSIVAAGSGTTYQWQSYDGAAWNDEGGQTTDTFDNPPTAVPGHPQREFYRCKVTRNAVDVFTTRKIVDVTQFNGQPQGGSLGDLGEGEPLTMEVDFGFVGSALTEGETGYTPSHTDFQWYKDGVPLVNDVGIPAATGELINNDDENAGKILFSLTTPEAGTYKVVLTTPNGAIVTSDDAVWTA